MTEDARRYRGPVTFWNSQLLPLVGFSKWERLDKARKDAIEAGWLTYEPGGRHRAGRYRVAIPPELQEVEDAAVDEGSTPSRHPYQEVKPDINRVSTGVTSLPVPIPKSKGESANAGTLSADHDKFLTAWNKSGLTRCRKLTDKRRRTLRTRLADSDWNSNWEAALARAVNSAFCSGSNDRGWKADVDWFLKPDSVTQILEGKFDDQKQRIGQRPAVAADDVMAKHTAAVLAQKRAEQDARRTTQRGCPS